MSPSVGSFSTTSRAKCRRSNCPNGKTAFAGSAIPGSEFIVSSSSRRPRSWAGVTCAISMNWDCGVITINDPKKLGFRTGFLLRGDDRLELQGEIDQPFFVPVDLPQIQPGPDLADLIANPARDQGGLGIIENDALLAIQPARRLVDLGNDRVEAEKENAISQHAVFRVESFALPREVVNELGDLLRIGRARATIAVPLASPSGISPVALLVNSSSSCV